MLCSVSSSFLFFNESIHGAIYVWTSVRSISGYLCFEVACDSNARCVIRAAVNGQRAERTRNCLTRPVTYSPLLSPVPREFQMQRVQRAMLSLTCGWDTFGCVYTILWMVWRRCLNLRKLFWRNGSIVHVRLIFLWFVWFHPFHSQLTNIIKMADKCMIFSIIKLFCIFQ